MGNKASCCSYSSPQPSPIPIEETLHEGEASVTNLQHISEREEDVDGEADPSQDPTAKTIFIERSKTAIENGMIRQGCNLKKKHFLTSFKTN